MIDKSVPKIINGCWQLSLSHNQGDSTYTSSSIIDLISNYIDAGLYVFDCADIYEGVEEALGNARASLSAKGKLMKFHTKFVPDLDMLETITERQIRDVINRSCRRLGVDSLDLVQFHWWDYNLGDYLSALSVLEKCKTEGKIKKIGLTNFDSKHLNRILDAGIDIYSVQAQYSLIDKRPEIEMLDICSSNNIKLFAYGSMCGGFLSERWLNVDNPSMDDLPNRSLIKYKAIIDDAGGWDEFQILLQTLKDIADRCGVSIFELVISYMTLHTDVDSLIVGVSRKYSSNDLRKMQDRVAIPSADLLSINELKDRFTLSGDVYELERDRTSVHGSIMKYNLCSKR